MAKAGSVRSTHPHASVRTVQVFGQRGSESLAWKLKLDSGLAGRAAGRERNRRRHVLRERFRPLRPVLAIWRRQELRLGPRVRCFWHAGVRECEDHLRKVMAVRCRKSLISNSAHRSVEASSSFHTFGLYNKRGRQVKCFPVWVNCASRGFRRSFPSLKWGTLMGCAVHPEKDTAHPPPQDKGLLGKESKAPSHLCTALQHCSA